MTEIMERLNMNQWLEDLEEPTPADYQLIEEYRHCPPRSMSAAEFKRSCEADDRIENQALKKQLPSIVEKWLPATTIPRRMVLVPSGVGLVRNRFLAPNPDQVITPKMKERYHALLKQFDIFTIYFALRQISNNVYLEVTQRKNGWLGIGQFTDEERLMYSIATILNRRFFESGYNSWEEVLKDGSEF